MPRLIDKILSEQPEQQVEDLSLRIPQARVLAALQPTHPDDPPSDWPVITKAMLAVCAGYVPLSEVTRPLSGTITRVLNGIREGSSSGDAHPGLLIRGMVEELVLDVEGTKEVSYRITPKGITAYRSHVAARGELPPLRDAATCTNDRYKRPT